MDIKTRKIDLNEYLKKISQTPNDIVERVCIINTETGEIFPTNEKNALADFERISRAQGCNYSLFMPKICKIR